MVGVALLIAIAVILATVIGLVVLGVGPGATEAPQAQLEAEYNTTADTITLTHQGGDALPRDEIRILNSDGTIKETPSGGAFDDGEMTAGESYTHDISSWNTTDVQIVWQDPSSESETVLEEFEA